MLAVVVFAARWGQPSRLLYGVDYELNVCGVNNALHTDQLRFTSARATRFPYEVLPKTAGVAMDVDPEIAAALKALQIQIGERDFAPPDGRWWAPGRGSRSYLLYADAAMRLPICVESCPKVAQPADGLALEARFCLYNFSSLSYAEQEAVASSHCFAAYDTVEIAGYCVPALPLAQKEYDAAGMAEQGSGGDTMPPVREADLLALREEVRKKSSERFFDAAVGGLIISWEVMCGTMLGAVGLGLLWLLLGGLLRLPTVM